MGIEPRGGFSADREAVLRGFGLPPEEARDDGASDGPADRDRVVRSLADSTRGIRAPRRYWTPTAASQIDDALDPFGYDLSFEPLDDRGIAPGDPFRIVLESRHWTRRIRFRSPDGGRATDDYAALVGAVDAELLPDSLRMVRLVDDGDHWQFLAVRPVDLLRMRDRYGERVAVGGRPLLAAHQPEPGSAELEPLHGTPAGLDRRTDPSGNSRHSGGPAPGDRRDRVDASPDGYGANRARTATTEAAAATAGGDGHSSGTDRGRAESTLDGGTDRGANGENDDSHRGDPDWRLTEEEWNEWRSDPEDRSRSDDEVSMEFTQVDVAESTDGVAESTDGVAESTDGVAESDDPVERLSDTVERLL